MQYAHCTIDGKTWEAFDFSQLPNADLENKRKALLCVECNEFAWFRKDSKHGHPAHFCAHHKDDCQLRIEYVVVPEARNSQTNEEASVGTDNIIFVNLEKEIADAIEVKTVQPSPPLGSSGGGTRYISEQGEQESSQQATLRKLLLRLVQSPNFHQSSQELVFYKSESEVLLNGRISDVVVNFSNINKEQHDNKYLAFWGPIASAQQSRKDKKIWLNSSAKYQSASIAIFEDIAEDFISSFKIESLELLAGAHVLVIGRCKYTSDNKPIIWCGTTKYITLRKYKDAKLQADL